MTPDLMTMNEAAETLRVSVETVRRLLDRGDLTRVRIGRRVLIDRADLTRYVASKVAQS